MPKWTNNFHHAEHCISVILEAQTLNLHSGEFSLSANLNFLKKISLLCPLLLVPVYTIVLWCLTMNISCPVLRKTWWRTSALIAVIAHPSVPSSVLVLYFFQHTCMNSSIQVSEKNIELVSTGEKRKKILLLSHLIMFHKVIKWLLRWVH